MRAVGSATSNLALAVALAVAVVLGCSSGPKPSNSFEPIDGATLLVRGERAATANQEAADALAKANAEFALDVYRALAAGNSDNIVLGPHSLSSALAMVYAGARGETAAEMARVLHFVDVGGEIPAAVDALDRTLALRNETDVVDFRTANQAFAVPGLPLVDSYLETLTRDFGAPLAELAFADPELARQVINKWAARRTNDKITELFPPGKLSPETVLVLVNAVSLDAKWHVLFDPAATTLGAFTLSDGTVVNVPMMHFDYYRPLVIGDDYQALELPYGTRSELSMVVILPDDLATFDATVGPDSLRAIFDEIREQGIHLTMPTFSFKSHPDMDATLQSLGMTRVYGDADLSGMIEGGGAFLQTVQHEAFIKVDESGTEAHAATGAGIAVSHGPGITLDRPFFFVIRDRATGAILFLGRVMDPRGP